MSDSRCRFGYGVAVSEGRGHPSGGVSDLYFQPSKKEEMNTDPLLTPSGSYERNSVVADLEQKLEQLKKLERQRVNVQVDMPSYAEQQPAREQTTVWDDIREEMNGMTETQRQMLAQDEEYRDCDMAISAIAAQLQMQMLMPYILQNKEGKRALERQLVTIRTKKEQIIRAEAQEMAEFHRWKNEQMKATSGTVKQK